MNTVTLHKDTLEESSHSDEGDNSQAGNATSTNLPLPRQRLRYRIMVGVSVGLIVLGGALSVWIGLSLAPSSNANASSRQDEVDNHVVTSAPTTPNQDEFVQLSSSEPTVAAVTQSPTFLPSASPSTSEPTMNPTLSPTETSIQVTTFFVVGDVPYNPQQALELGLQMDGIPATADFVVHVGDIRSASENNQCRLQEYQEVSELLQRSAVPVFIVPGDNEWNDCPNILQGWQFWEDTFMSFESRFWDVSALGDVIRMSDRPETFSFVHRETLFVGLNLVGGRLHNAVEWQTRLSTQVEWLKTLMLQHQRPTVVFGHADPTANHEAFFGPLRDFMQDEIQNSIPLLYVNGDRHRWEFNQSFFDQPNWQRIMVTGGTTDPPVKVEASAGPSIRFASEAFAYDRQL